jgi:hypothetical protein
MPLLVGMRKEVSALADYLYNLVSKESASAGDKTAAVVAGANAIAQENKSAK